MRDCQPRLVNIDLARCASVVAKKLGGKYDCLDGASGGNNSGPQKERLILKMWYPYSNRTAWAFVGYGLCSSKIISRMSFLLNKPLAPRSTPASCPSTSIFITPTPPNRNISSVVSLIGMDCSCISRLASPQFAASSLDRPSSPSPWWSDSAREITSMGAIPKEPQPSIFAFKIGSNGGNGSKLNTRPRTPVAIANTSVIYPMFAPTSIAMSPGSVNLIKASVIGRSYTPCAAIEPPMASAGQALIVHPHGSGREMIALVRSNDMRLKNCCGRQQYSGLNGFSMQANIITFLHHETGRKYEH
jgi:hypothetical protein